MTFDKFLNRSIKILLSCVMVVSITIITLFVTPISVHAEDAQYYIELPYKYPSSYSSDGVLYGSNKILLTSRNLVSDPQPVYMVAVSSSGNSWLCFVTADTINTYVIQFGASSSDNTDLYKFSSGSNLYNGYVYRTLFGANNLLNQAGLTSFASIQEAIDYIASASVAPSFQRSITIKPGYVAYVQTDGGTLDLVAQFHEFSRFSRPLWDNGIRISFNGGLVPTSGTIFNESFGSPVDWLKVASAPSNLLGQTMTGGFSYTAGLPEAGSNKCVVIYNPAYGNANTLVGNGTIDLGVYVTATFSNLVDVTQYKLRADATVTYSSGAAVSSGSPDDYNLAYTYIPSDNDPSDVVTDSDYKLLDISSNTSGPAIDMNAGGYNGTSDYDNNNPEEAENGILGLLTRILKFLSAPISHIMSLFNAGGNFMSWLGQLWIWLPSDVGAILVDALFVLIVIGAIKFLWK